LKTPKMHKISNLHVQMNGLRAEKDNLAYDMAS